MAKTMLEQAELPAMPETARETEPAVAYAPPMPGTVQAFPFVSPTSVEKLTEPFDRALVKQRAGSYGKELDYVTTETVIRRLNVATDNHWDFSVDRFWVEAERAFALVTLSLPGLGSRSHIGVQALSNRAGSEDVDAKGAISDALKKAATLFGVALELYGGADAPSGNADAPVDLRGTYAQRDSAPVPDGAFACEECGAPIKGFTSKTGRAYTSADAAGFSKKDYGAVLCWNCKQQHAKLS